MYLIVAEDGGLSYAEKLDEIILDSFREGLCDVVRYEAGFYETLNIAENDEFEWIRPNKNTWADDAAEQESQT